MAATISWTDTAGTFNFVALDVYDEETHGYEAECTKFPAETGGPITDNVRLGNRVLQLVGFVSNTPLPQNDGRGSYQSRNLTIPDSDVWEGKSTKLDIPEGNIKPNLAGLVSAGFNALFGSAPEALLRKKTGTKSYYITANAWGPTDGTRSRVKEVWDLLEKVHLAKLRVDVTTEHLGLVSGLVITSLQAPIKTDDGNGSPFSLNFEQIRTVTAETVAAPKPLERSGQPKKSAGSKAAKPVTEEERKAKLQSLATTFLDQALSGGGGGHG